MKIAKSSSDFLNSVTAQAAPAAEPQQQGTAEGVRDSAEIATAISNAAKGLGLEVDTQEMPIPGNAKSFSVHCTGARAGLEIVFNIYPFGDMEGNIKRGLEKGDGARKIMRQIVANAVRDGGIVALPGHAKFDPLLASNPNHYREALSQQQAQQNQQVQQPPLGNPTPEVM